MNVVHLNTKDTSGGAARAAHRLHRGLREAEVDSSMFVKNKDSEDETVDEWEPNRSIFDRLKDRIKRHWLKYRFSRYQDTRPDDVGAFSQARTLGGNCVADALPGADIYNLHSIRGFIDPLPFFKKTQQPVVWTLHDMNPFTGGCHYSMGCTEYHQRCGQCPQLGSTDENDLSRSVWSRKRAAYQQAIADNRLHVVTPSKWLAQGARQSSLLSGAPIHVIQNGIPHKTFTPRDTDGVRVALEIPDAHRVLLFVAGSTKYYLKGFGLLTDALKLTSLENVTLLSIGSGEPELPVSVPHKHLGSINSDLLLSVFYSLADVFAIPSRQDNLPNTILESMACGTPVVGFDVGGIPDVVRPGETGWLAEADNAGALGAKIREAITNDAARRRLGLQAREVIKREYTVQNIASKYTNVYENIK